MPPSNLPNYIKENFQSGKNQNHFSLDISSKKGSAFNNLRPGVSALKNNEKEDKPNNQNITNLYQENSNNNQEINYNEKLLNQLGINPYGLSNANGNYGSLLGMGTNGLANPGLGRNAGLAGLGANTGLGAGLEANAGLGLGNLGALAGLGGLGNLSLGLQQANNQQNQKNSQNFNQSGLGGLGQNLGLLGLGNLGLGGGYPGYNMNLSQLLGQVGSQQPNQTKSI